MRCVGGGSSTASCCRATVLFCSGSVNWQVLTMIKLTLSLSASSDVQSEEAGESVRRLTILERTKCKVKELIKWLCLSSYLHFKSIFQ